MTEIQEKYQAIADQLVGKNVTLVPVSKKKPVEDLMQVYEVGGRIFGENYVQELTEKHEQMPKDIEWHLLGHLQRNKVKYIASFINLIHSVDSLKLLREINKQAAKNERVINCLLQVFIAEEDSKTGMDENELPEALAALSDLPNVNVVGLMGISTFTDNKEVVTREFRHLRKMYDEGKGSHSEWNVLSMGMSGDWQLAIEEGSTLIRVGTSIFGARK
jgi:pyridoxal phosphate enzyme (YggS family)